MRETLKLYLASKSPRRRELLDEAGLVFTVRPPVEPVDETLSDEEWQNPAQAAETLAERKAAMLVSELLGETIAGPTMVIGADTIVVVDGEVFGKPRSLSDGKRMLRRLSGRTHEVITAVSLWAIEPDAQGKVTMGRKTFSDVAAVTFRPLTEEEIAAYLKLGESFDKAGAYAAQGEGAKLIASIEGDRATVIGFPVQRTLSEFPQLRDAR